MKEKAYVTIAERAAKVAAARRLSKILPIILSGLFVLLLTTYLGSMMYMKFGSFSVSVNKYDQLKYGLSLSETRDFAKTTANLNCRSFEEVTNIDGATLDTLPLGMHDGEDNGTNYLCYTFYCKNTGEEIVNYQANIVVTNATLGIEEAVRVRVMETLNDGQTSKCDYAVAKGVDEYGIAIPEDNTTPFYTKNVVMRQDVNNFAPGDVMKYTVVIWVEGPDAQAVDDIIGGEFKIDMKFEVLGSSEINS